MEKIEYCVVTMKKVSLCTCGCKVKSSVKQNDWDSWNGCPKFWTRVIEKRAADAAKAAGYDVEPKLNVLSKGTYRAEHALFSGNSKSEMLFVTFDNQFVPKEVSVSWERTG